jgi:transposase-like protein
VSDANVVQLLQPGSFADPLTEVLRNGARALLAQAVEAEVAEFLAKHADLKTASGLSRVVRHGHLPERAVMTGIGPVGVRQPRVRDRGVAAENAERIRFTPVILPPYARRSRSLEVLIPILYLKGISTGDFEEALAALLGKDAPGLSASTIARLKEVWLDEHEHWRKRDLSARRYVYVWADGIYLQARLEDAKQCILVIIGATPEGKKELLGFIDGARESAPDWRELLLGVWSSRPSLPPPTVRLGSGRRSARSGRLHASSAAGSTRPPTSSINCPRASSRKPNGHYRRSGWPRPARMPRPPSTPSSRPTS